MASYNFQLGSVPAERVGQEEVGRFQPWAHAGNMAGSELSCRKPGVGHFSPLVRKQSSDHVGPPFLALRLFSRSVGATNGKEP